MENCRFEFIDKYANAGLSLPERKTASSAGYDFVCAENTVIPSLSIMTKNVKEALAVAIEDDQYLDLATMAELTKQSGFRPTLVPTGVKCKMPNDCYLELSVRSSTPLKHWVILGNGVGIIDADYYGNPDNDGHIYFQLINLSPFNIIIKKGEIIGQGIIHHYETTEDDGACGDRTGGFGSTSV